MKFCKHCSQSHDAPHSEFCARPDCVADRMGVAKRAKLLDRVEVKSPKRRKKIRRAKRKPQWEARSPIPMEEQAVNKADAPRWTANRYLDKDTQRRLGELQARLQREQ